MIKDIELREKLYREFPPIPDKIIDEIERDCLQQFLFYRKGKNKATVYCTSCRRWETYHKKLVVDGIEINGSAVPDKLWHNNDIICPMCGHAVKCKSEGRGRKSLKARGNYCIFSAKGDNLYVQAIKYQIGWEDIDDPEADIYEFKKYVFTPQGSQSWRWKWDCVDMVPMNKISEPMFALDGGIWRAYDYEREDDRRLYTCVNEEAIYSTFLKYQEFHRLAHGTNTPMSYLEHMAKYPDITEKLTKAGFDAVVDDICSYGNMHKFNKLINWRAKTLRDALRMNSAEIKHWQKALKTAKGIADLAEYQKSKKITSDYKKLLEMFEKYSSTDAYKLCQASDICNASLVKVCNYVDKIHNTADRHKYIGNWHDCLSMMAELGYPKGNSLCFPKNLTKLHDRLVKEMNALKKEKAKAANAKLDAKITNSKKERSKLIYSNYLYTIVLPESIEDIHREGRMLEHCVASYDERHAKGELHILFVRRQWDLDTPWYTIEVSNDGYICQWYGYKNNRTIAKHPDMKQFIDEYKLFLDYQYGRIKQEEYDSKLMKLDTNGGYNDGTDEHTIQIA